MTMLKEVSSQTKMSMKRDVENHLLAETAFSSTFLSLSSRLVSSSLHWRCKTLARASSVQGLHDQDSSRQKQYTRNGHQV